MTTDEIRKKFLDFFAAKGHTIVPSDSLVPKNDPTVLFTTAGMQQFKKYFLGNVDGYTRAASSQKCLRTDDLEQVGKTDFHHTFFEMLGNFSFGDYFKKEAISWAWEFLTKELKIPKERLWVSVYKEDSEAENIWLKDIGIDAKKIVRLGDHSNFWPADAKEKGPNGPCGPCSEIFYDYGINENCPKAGECNPDCDCGRFSEIWNLVFTQFERKEDGTIEPLPNKNIDTGMGLERLASILQGKKNNFETDLFTLIIAAIKTEIENGEFKINLQEKRIIADHIRAIVFAINDGIIPSNKERGYVIKGLINAATNIALSNGAVKACIYKLVPPLINTMKENYPELCDKSEDIASLIKKTEEAFILVRKQRIPELESYNFTGMTTEERGKIYFKFHDTYGLPLTTILESAQKSGLAKKNIDEDILHYNKYMDEQKQMSRDSSKMNGDVFVNTLNITAQKTEFLGYEHSQSSATIISMFIGNQETDVIQAGDEVKIILDKTPFYAESGGQVGDSGIIEGNNGLIRIKDTHKISDTFIHLGIVEKGSFKRNGHVQAKIDAGRRLSITRNHTATHLLQAALREVLGNHVQQQGSFVSDTQLRFDFTHHKAVTTEQIFQIEKRVNELAIACDPVIKEYMPVEEAKKSGALAFFAEKYGDVVLVVSIGDYSKEFCGGTHLDTTGQIGFIKITGESAIAQGIRRLEAKTGMQAFQFLREKELLLEKASDILKTPLNGIIGRLNNQAIRLKQQDKELEIFRFEVVKNSVDSILNTAENLNNGCKFICHLLKDVDIAELRKLCDLIKIKAKSYVIILGTSTKENAFVLIAVSDDLIKKEIRADELIKKIAPFINGSGGGRPQQAQAGSKEINKVAEAIQQANKIIKKNLIIKLG